MNCRRLSVEFRKPELALFLCFDISIPFAHPEISARNHLTDERWRVNPFACLSFLFLDNTARHQVEEKILARSVNRGIHRQGEKS
jgi:hypothetical protein